MHPSIVDTNVLLVASGRHTDMSPECVTSCITHLSEIMNRGRVTLDDTHRILDEYMKKTDPNRGKHVGQVFLKWLLRNLSSCLYVTLHEHPERGFASFPEDPELALFDPSDRKFVAVAAACEECPPILQAADSKWLGWADALLRNGVNVEFLCPEDLKRFRARKGLP